MKKIIALAVAAAFSTCLFAGVALAADSDPDSSATGTTDMYLYADDAQISWTVPLAVTFAVNADGTFQTPTNGSFVNNSVFAIHVAKASVSAKGGATLVADAANVGADKIWVEITSGLGGTMSLGDYTTEAALTAGKWDMAKTDGAAGGDDELSTAYAGKIGSFDTINPASKVNFAQITWIAKAGTAAQHAAKAGWTEE